MGIRSTNSTKPLVSIVCITYNHEAFIRDALDGFLMQQTNFKFEIVIGEDCSIDSTKIICEEYAAKYSSINLLPSIKNLGMNPNTIRTYTACKGKYIAICEGDDYWTDPYKLQKQVDFLDTHSDYGLVHSDFDKLYEKSGRIIRNFKKKNKIYKSYDTNIFNGLLTNQYIITTNTVMVKRKLLLKALNDLDLSGYLMTDLPTWLAMTQLTKFHYFNESMGVYRKIKGSVSTDISTQNSFILSGLRIRLDFAERYSAPNKIKKKLQKDYLWNILLKAFYSKDLQLRVQYFNNMKSNNFKMNLYEYFVYFSIDNTILRAVFLGFEKFKKSIIFLLNYIIKKNL